MFKPSRFWMLIFFLFLMWFLRIYHIAETWGDRVLVVMLSFCDVVSMTGWMLQSSMEHPVMKERQQERNEISPDFPATLNNGRDTKKINVPNQTYASTVKEEKIDTRRLFFLRLVRIMDRNDLTDKPAEWLKEDRWIPYFDGSRFRYAKFRDANLVRTGIAKKEGIGNKPFVVVDRDRVRRLADGREKLPLPQ